MTAPNSIFIVVEKACFNYKGEGSFEIDDKYAVFLILLFLV